MDQARYEEIKKLLFSEKDPAFLGAHMIDEQFWLAQEHGTKFMLFLEGDFTADQLEAIARWMRKNGEPR